MVEVDAGTLSRTRHRRSRWALAGVAGAAVVALAGGLVLGRAVMLRNAVLPGVTVAGIEVGALDRAGAQARIESTLGANLDRRVFVAVGDRGFATQPSALYRLDGSATAELAYDAGRGSIFSRLASVVAPFAFDREVAPVLRVRPAGQDALVKRLARLTRRPVSARVRMDAAGPVVEDGRFGTEVDQAAFVAELRRVALNGGGAIRADVLVVAPALTTAEASRAARRVKGIVSTPVAIRLKGDTLGELSTRTLAGLVRFQPHAGAFRVVLPRDAVERAVAPLVAGKAKEPVDATFAVVGKRVRVIPSKGGTQLATRKAAAAILAAGRGNGPRVAAVGLTTLAADLTTRDAKALGIRKQLTSFTTDMGPSSANRITNVLLMGKYLDGTLVRPGETFSFNGVIGPRTAERGFVEGQMILGGLLVPSIGGGVCQVATTIFNTAFDTGLPVGERYNHSFYISHYPMGRDAAVSWGGPDLVFRNDLDHAILIKAGGDSATFTVSFYGTRQGRKVIATTSTPTNYAQPTLQYAVDPSAPPKSVRTEPGGGPGFDVNVHRKVLQRGKVVREDDFFTRYTPQNPTAVYGPGRTPPGPYFTLPPSA